MALITYIEHDGTSHKVEVDEGSNVMQGAVDNLIKGIVAECGGCCSCATCHCYVDDAWADKIEPADSMEQEMISCVAFQQENSRLSCQIEVSDQLDGLVVRLPESQFE